MAALVVIELLVICSPVVAGKCSVLQREHSALQQEVAALKRENAVLKGRGKCDVLQREHSALQQEVAALKQKSAVLTGRFEVASHSRVVDAVVQPHPSTAKEYPEIRALPVSSPSSRQLLAGNLPAVAHRPPPVASRTLSNKLILSREQTRHARPRTSSAL
jgi:hypothetical protein